MELPLRGVDELSTAGAQRVHSRYDSAQQNNFTYEAEYDLSLETENPILDWYGVFDRTAGVDSTMGGFQHNQMLQSPQLPLFNMFTTDSFDLLTNMPDVLPITWFPVDQPINHHLYSNRPPSPSYEQLVNPSIYAERGMMESRPNLPLSLVSQHQNTLWPTGEERGSNLEIPNSNSDSNFVNDNGLSTSFEPYTPSESSAESHSPNTTTSTPRSSKSQSSDKQRRKSQKYPKPSVAVAKRRGLTTALVSIPVRCMACKASRIACVGPPDCKRCRLKCIPAQMYTTRKVICSTYMISNQQDLLDLAGFVKTCTVQRVELLQFHHEKPQTNNCQEKMIL